MKKSMVILCVVIFVFFFYSQSVAFTILNETDFFQQYSDPVLVTSLSDKGSVSDAWLVRGYTSGVFWEDVSFGYERGLDSPYPIRLTVGHYLSVNAPFGSATPVAIYTDKGFWGIVPGNSSDIFYRLPGTTSISQISTVSPAPAPVPEPSTILLVATGLIGFAGFRKKFKNP